MGEADLDKLKMKGLANVVVPDFHFRSVTPIIQIKEVLCTYPSLPFESAPRPLSNTIQRRHQSIRMG